MPPPTVTCILGMRRSGTSLAAGVLHSLGVDLGHEEHLAGPAPDNPKGFWEHRWIVKLNDQILERLGGSYARPPALGPGWETAPVLGELRKRARQIIQAEFDGKPLWGWKDPRTCLTLPFWKQLVPGLRYVICLRSAVEVARSLARREGLSVERGIDLWLRHTQLALQHTRGEPRILVCYEQLIDDWRAQLERLASFLGTPERAAQPDVQAAVHDFIDPSLRHHRMQVDPTTEDRDSDVLSRALELAQHIYAALKRDGDALGQHDIDRQLQQAIECLAPEVQRQEQEESRQWQAQVSQALEEIARVVPAGATFLLADGGQWGAEAVVAGRRRVPFLERDGRAWGPPPDDATGLRELERMRQSGVSFFVLGWPAFWWRDYYPGLHHHLRSTFPCRVENERLMIFDLRRLDQRAPSAPM